VESIVAVSHRGARGDTPGYSPKSFHSVTNPDTVGHG
jgi:hypothetical protein